MFGVDDEAAQKAFSDYFMQVSQVMFPSIFKYLTSFTANVMSEKQESELPVGLPDAATESLKNGNFREASALLLAHPLEQA
jgi:hypothetical protein